MNRVRLLLSIAFTFYLFSCEKEEEIPDPILTSFEPTSGIEGTIITVTGKNFGQDPLVKMGGDQVTLIQASETSVAFAVPQNVRSGEISLTTAKGKLVVFHEYFRVLHPPVINSFEPSHGPIGTYIEIHGANMPIKSVVKIGGSPVEVKGTLSDGLRIRVSPGASSGKITVETEGGVRESTSEFTVDIHTITKIVSHYALVRNIQEELKVSGQGHSIYIEGENFSSVLAENVIKLNDKTIPIVSSNSNTTRLRVVIPEGATSGKFTVTIGSTTAESYHLTIAPGRWIRKKDFPAPRNRAFVFTINNINNLKAYIGTGKDNSTYLTDLWEYDPLNDLWTKKTDFPGVGRYDALAFSVNGKGYVGRGTALGVGFLKDFWEYDPISNTWSKKNDAPYLAENASFTINGKGYFIEGIGSDVCEYSPEDDSWIRRQPYSGYRYDAITVSVGDRAYVGTGLTNTDSNLTYYKDFWEFDQNSLQWSKKADFPGQARAYCVAFILKGKIYVGAGKTIDSREPEDFWVYDPNTDQWSQSAPMQMNYGLKTTYFSLGDKGYFVTPGGQVWEFNPEL